MYFWITHESLYRYDVPVRLAPHVLRLSPRTDALRLVSQRLEVDPVPNAQSVEVDAFGNALTQLAFVGATQTLRVTSELELETFPHASFDGHLAALQYGADPNAHPDVRAFAEQIARGTYDDPIAFLDRLSWSLFTHTRRDDRESGDARPSHETLRLGVGACRDLTVLFLDAARALGLGGHFVSGYHAEPGKPDGPSHLHAWAEIFLPGLGQRGWDPMNGVRVSEGYVPLCAAPSQAATMPISGGFYFDGPTVNSTLDYTLRIATR